MGILGFTTQDDRIEALARDTNQQIHLVAKLVSSMHVSLLEMETCVRDLDQTVRGFSTKLGEIMSNQDRANEIAAGIAEDTETIARFTDMFAVAVNNYEAELASLREQLTAEQADDIDLSGIEESASQLRALSDVLEAVMSPDQPSPVPEDVPEIAPVEEGAAADEGSAVEDVVAEDTSAPAGGPVEGEAAADEPVVTADESVTPVEEVAAPAEEAAPTEGGEVVGEPAATESTDATTDDGTTKE